MPLTSTQPSAGALAGAVERGLEAGGPRATCRGGVEHALHEVRAAEPTTTTSSVTAYAIWRLPPGAATGHVARPAGRACAEVRQVDGRDRRAAVGPRR